MSKNNGYITVPVSFALATSTRFLARLYQQLYDLTVDDANDVTEVQTAATLANSLSIKEITISTKMASLLKGHQ